MKILHISDTHGYHGLLNIPTDIDMIIHSGDISNSRNPILSNNECLDAIEWLGSLNIPVILVAGNHDIALERGMITKQQMAEKGITYLYNEGITIDGVNFWGSPFTPSFGVGWAFNRKRDKLHDLWATIPEKTNVVITHGPPKGILDHSYNQTGNVYERCGCAALLKRMLKIEPKYCLFGHIHNCEDIINAGTTKLSAYSTIYSNGSVVTDGKFGRLSSQGNTLTI